MCEDNNYSSSSSSLPDDILQQQGQINGKWLPKILVSSKINFCLRGEPLKNSFDGNLIKCGKLNKEKEEENECPNTYYCHIGESDEESGCCLKTGVFIIFKLIKIF